MTTTPNIDIPAASLPAPVEAAPTGHAAGDPAILGLPIFAAGSIALGLALVGYVPAVAVTSVLPIVLAATGLGLLISTVWAASLGQTVVAGIFGLFTGFWLSYAALLLGLNHNWFLIPTEAVERSIALFLITWAVVMFALAVGTLRLPLAYTLVIGLVVVALVLLIFGTTETSETLNKMAGYVVLAFGALGIYLFLSTASIALGGSGYPLGSPVISDD